MISYIDISYIYINRNIYMKIYTKTWLKHTHIHAFELILYQLMYRLTIVLLGADFVYRITKELWCPWNETWGLGYCKPSLPAYNVLKAVVFAGFCKNQTFVSLCKLDAVLFLKNISPSHCKWISPRLLVAPVVGVQAQKFFSTARLGL